MIRRDIAALLGASCIWSFAFGLVGATLAGVPAAASAEIRLLVAALLFLPFLRRIDFVDATALCAIGAVQFGLMSLCYMAAFAHLPSWQVALLTVMTPVYVSLLNDAIERKFHPRNLLAAFLAVLGAGIVLWQSNAEWKHSIVGFLLVESSNLCFALGQMGYRAWMRRDTAPRGNASAFFWLYFGGTIALALPAFRSGLPALSAVQWGTLLYLGIVVSGLSYFLWNFGARTAPAGALAVLNNLKIPLGVAVSIIVFGERAPIIPLLAGATLMAVALKTSVSSPKH